MFSDANESPDSGMIEHQTSHNTSILSDQDSFDDAVEDYDEVVGTATALYLFDGKLRCDMLVNVHCSFHRE